MAREYSTEELLRKLQNENERFILVDTLPARSYVNRHLPGAINLPLEQVEERAEEVLPDKDVEVVVYCASPA